MPTLRIARALTPAQLPLDASGGFRLGPGLYVTRPGAMLSEMRRSLRDHRPGSLAHRAARIRLRLCLRAKRAASPTSTDA